MDHSFLRTESSKPLEGTTHLLFRAAAAKKSRPVSIYPGRPSKLYLTLVRSLHMNSTVQLSIVGDLPQIYFL